MRQEGGDHGGACTVAEEDEHVGFHRIEAPGFAPFWAVVDHAAVLDVDRRAHPTDDLATLIANGVVDGQPIAELPMLGY